MQIDEYLQSRGYNMTTIYKHATGTSCIEAVKRQDGSTDIMMTCGIGTTHESMMRHALPINECDRFGAALCKDIINNYREHNDHLKQREEDARLMVADLESVIHDLRTNIRGHDTALSDCIVEHNQHAHQLCARIEYLEAITKGHDDCKEAFFKLLDQRSELEATNRGLEQDISNFRIANALYRKRWSEHETESASPEPHRIRSRIFACMVKGYHGKLSRHGKTIIISLPFKHESVARNAEKYIVGLDG